MRDVDDADGDVEADVDADVEEDADASSSSQGSDAEDANGEGDAQRDVEGQDPGTTTTKQAEDLLPAPTLPSVRPEALTALTYDIAPTIAAPQSTSINAITATADMRWVFSGGSDGYIRKYNWVETVNSKLMLTVAQRHPFVDSVVKAGVLMGYWENWDVPSRNASSDLPAESTVLSPVYSMAVQSQGLWLLAGTDSGNIRLQSIRHDEGKEIALLRRHTSAVSALLLSSDERSLLSGSWDKHVLDWDLNTGQVRTSFSSGSGQISSIESRPISGLSVPEESGELPVTNGTYSSNSHVNGTAPLANGVSSREQSHPLQDEAPPDASPNSLFSGDDGDDDLFGDSAGTALTNGAPLMDAFGEDDMAAHVGQNGLAVSNSDDVQMAEAVEGLQPVQPPETSLVPDGHIAASSGVNGVVETSTRPQLNGLPHAEDNESLKTTQESTSATEPGATLDSTFLATSFDGTIRVWDRRQPTPVARIVPRNTPPWCMSACWSPDGNNIYAGRRNCTVEEYDLRKGLKAPERVFKFPQGSGSVTSVKAMPNGRHLIWYVLHPTSTCPTFL